MASLSHEVGIITARYTMDHLTPYNAFTSLLIVWVAFKFIQFFLIRRRSARLIRLKGPPNNNFFFGSTRKVLPSKDRLSVYERWVNEYGLVFQMPIHLGGRSVILCDPKAIGHLFSKDTFAYFRTPFAKVVSRTFFGPNMLVAESEDHRRQRRALSPAFSNAALRAVTSVFYDSAYKVKAIWSLSFESSDEAIIDVQKWINRITLDSIGIAGFGHDFKALEGYESPILKVFESFNNIGSSGRRSFLLLGPIFPQMLKLPTERSRMFRQMSKATSDMATHFLENSQSERESFQYVKDKSILGLLVKGESNDKNFKLNHEEVVSQGLLLIAGYETTSVSLSWALVEIARNSEVQRKLRNELHGFASSDPTWDQLTSGMPYLDAVVHETLRLHPPLEQLNRMAMEDDIVPLSSPIETASGQTIDSLVIPKGTKLTIPVSFINRNERFWGPDANSFVPERWLEENPYMPKDLHGHRHLLTFGDGPRLCLGKGFALAEFKGVLSVLVRYFSFELLNGLDTKLDVHLTFFPRPKLAGEVGPVLPMRVRQVLG